MATDWIIAVEPQPRDEAERALASWLKDQASCGNTYSDGEIREDVILSKVRSQLIRYCVSPKENNNPTT